MQWLNRFLKLHPRLFDLALRLKSSHGYTDEIFKEFSRKLNGDVRFIQIGAADGLRWDPMRRYVVMHGWKGVFVEPVPSTFDLLKKNYAHHKGLTFVNAAIVGENTELQFWTFSPPFLASIPIEARTFYLRKSSFEKRLAIAAATEYTDVEREFLAKNGFPPRDVSEHVVSILVQSMTLNTLVERYNIDRVDFLMIDTEGHEAEIIPAIDFKRVRPRAILYENMNMKPDDREKVAAYLMWNGYTVRDLAHSDSFATRND